MIKGMFDIIQDSIKQVSKVFEAIHDFEAHMTGTLGEKILDFKYTRLLNKDDYQVFNDIVIKAGKNTTQVDQVIVSRYGIFVVEIKTRTGWIFGSEQQQRWTQKINSYSSYQFQNPLHQNKRHINALASLLQLPQDRFISLIVFVGAELKTSFPENVITSFGYLDYISRYKNVVFSESQVSTIVKTISINLLPGKDHKEYIKTLKDRQTNIKVCPRCGSDMILRTAIRGARAGAKFWGCSKFPGCRGTRQYN